MSSIPREDAGATPTPTPPDNNNKNNEYESDHDHDDNSTINDDTVMEMALDMDPPGRFLAAQSDQSQRLADQTSKPTTSLVESLQQHWQESPGPALLARTSTHTLVAIAASMIGTLASPTGRATLAWVLRQGWSIVGTVVGVALGVGLGLGLATHVYDQLDVWERRQRERELYGWTTAATRTTDGVLEGINAGGGGGGGGGMTMESGRDDVMARSATPWRRYSSATAPVQQQWTSSPSFSQQQQQQPFLHPSMRARTLSTSSFGTAAGRRGLHTASILEDEQSYLSLMTSAGYLVSSKYYHPPSVPLWPRTLARGQVVLNPTTSPSYDEASNKNKDSAIAASTTADPAAVHYRFTDLPNRNDWRAVACIRYVAPTVPASVQTALGRAIELLLRDYVGIWYGKADPGCVYEPPSTTTDDDETTKEEDKKDDKSTSSSTNHYRRRMLYALSPHRPLPFLDALYESCAVVFGNLATRVEHVNALELVLLKWVRVLAHTFKWYRVLRKSVRTKQLLAQQQQDGSTASDAQHRRNHPQRRGRPPPHNANGGGAFPGTTGNSANTTAGSGGGNNINSINNSVANMGGAVGGAVGSVVGAAAGPLRRRLAKTQPVPGSIPGIIPTGSANNNNGTTATTNHPQHNNNGGPPALDAHVPVSEMAMTREFLLSGKLHRAVTFGMDVPSLLFADASGKECGAPTTPTTVFEIPAPAPAKRDSTGHDKPTTGENGGDGDDDVLEARLYGTNLLTECELDYNRVIGHKMVRALVAREDFGCCIVSSLLTEIMGGCVLTPIMSMFSPEYMNSWIIMGLDKVEKDRGETNNTTFTSGVDGGEYGDASHSNGASVSKAEQGAGHGHGEGCEAPSVLENTGAAEVELTDSMKDMPHARPSTVEKVAAPKKSIAQREQERSRAVSFDSLDAPGVRQMTAERKTTEKSTVADSQASFGLTPFTVPDESDLGGMSPLLTMALIDLQQFADFEECRVDGVTHETIKVEWESPGCRAAVLKVVLVIEAALMHGRCSYRSAGHESKVMAGISQDNHEDLNDSDRPVEVTLPEYESSTLIQLLMELTSDFDAFQEKVETENSMCLEQTKNMFDDMIVESYQPTATEQSTLRTLISAWLQTGQIYRTISLLVQAHATVLAPYYHNTAFLRSEDEADGFVRQLRALTDVQIMVDTVTVLGSPRLQDMTDADLSIFVQRSVNNPASPPRQIGSGEQNTSTSPAALSTPFMPSSATIPRHLDFNRNESFAASLRSERERRMQSWSRIVQEDSSDYHPVYCRLHKPVDDHIALHKELHHVARMFYAGTNMLALRDAARRTTKNPNGGSLSTGSEGSTEDVQVSLITVENACPRRRIEVPDDDSSFLLRAQPRPLNAVGVHRDQRNHDQSFKCFAATYEEPALSVGSEHFTGGRYIRRCLIRYFPIDRTATVTIQNDSRKLDQRKTKSPVPDTITLTQSPRPAPFLSADFLKERHLCQRWVPKGTTRTQSLLASSVMEPSDFTLAPRPGRAIEYVYRLTLFEKCAIDLGGKIFTVQDSSSLGAHRADGSALEMSDASLSACLLTLGSDDEGVQDSNSQQQGVEMGKDGYPVVWMKFSRKDDAHVEVKPYRTSFVRAALMVTAARQEAQLQILLKCVLAGSAKKATKALTDTKLRQTQKLIEYASNIDRAKQSLLMRDLKLGVNHIDRDQLRRNALLSPRYPTELLTLSATVEDAVESYDPKGVDIFGGSNTVYKIKCCAVVSLVVSDDELLDDAGYKHGNGTFAETYEEEWVIYRSMKEFQCFHKHIKMQVSVSESSGTAGSRLFGAANAAFAATTLQGRHRQKKMLIPSLSQANKAGGLGITKKSILKRQEILAGYLGYILSPGHLLGRCSELLLFLGASFPLSPLVRVGEMPTKQESDLLGRSHMTRNILQQKVVEKEIAHSAVAAEASGRAPRTTSTSSQVSDELEDDIDDEDELELRKSGRNLNMIPAVRNKIDKVTLQQVRNCLFELLRYQFGFENASFARNRMLAALKTASHAVTSAAEFRKTLYKLHTENLNSDAIAGWIDFLCETLWPDGVFFESKPPTPDQQLKDDAIKSKQLLYESFPDQVRAILGQELTRDGLSVLHEMLQNRIVVKSMAYMLFDLLWVEIFPEIGDTLPCGAALDISDP